MHGIFVRPRPKACKLLFFLLLTIQFQALVLAQEHVPRIRPQESDESSPPPAVYKESGKLEVRVDKALEGARLWIDNVLVAESLTVETTTFQLPVGIHTVRIEKTGIPIPQIDPIPITIERPVVLTLHVDNQPSSSPGLSQSHQEVQKTDPAPPMVSSPVPAGQGWLSIETFPDARISIDDVLQPNKYSLPVTAGLHKIVISAPGMSPRKLFALVPKNTHVVANARWSAEITENAPPPLGIIQGITDADNPPPPNATYWINGRKTSLQELETGVQTPEGPVVFVIENQQRDRCLVEQFSLQAGGNHPVHLACKNQGVVYLYSQPSGAEVKIRKLQKRPSTDEMPPTTTADPKQPGQEILISQGVTPMELSLPAGEVTAIYLVKEGYEIEPLLVQVSAGQRTQVSTLLRPGNHLLSPWASLNTPTPEEQKRIDAEKEQRDQQISLQHREELGVTSALTTPKGHFVGFINPGFPYYFSAGIHTGLWRSASNHHGIDITTQVRSTFLFGEAVVGLRFMLQKSDPFVIGAYALVSGGGALRGGSTFSLETGLPLTLRAAHWVHLTITPVLQFYSDQYCPTENTIQDIQRQNDPASLVALGTARYEGDGCTTQGKYNPIYAAAGATDPKVASTLPYRNMDGKVRSEFLIDGTPVLDRFNQLRVSLQFSGDVKIPHVPLSVFFSLRWTPGQKERPMFSQPLGRFMPSHEGVDPNIPGNALHGSAGLAYRY